MIGLGVASFSHIQGTHFQNDTEFESYQQKVRAGELPIHRALTPTLEERMIREFVLQMKRGKADRSYFQNKFGVDINERFLPACEKIRAAGYLTLTEAGPQLSRDGLLQVDRLLHEFFKPEHRVSRIV